MNTAIPPERDELIDLYLNGKLQGEELATFEISMMEDAELFEQVQFMDALKQTLRNERAALSRDIDDSHSVVSKGGAQILPFRTWCRQPLSLAASVMVAVLGLHFVQSKFFVPATQITAPDTAPTISAPTSLGIGSVLMLETSRGDTPLQFSGAMPYLFQIDVGLGNDAEEFAVSLKDASNQELMKKAGLKADADGWVRVVLNQALTGNYQLDLQWTDRAGAAQSRVFPIKIGE